MSNPLICMPVMLPVRELLDSFDDYIGLILKSKKEVPHLMTASPGRQIQLLINKLGYNPQHLYLVSDEEMKNLDYFIKNNSIYTYVRGFINSSLGGKKIVATTDKSLGLPPIPESFIEEYVQKQGKIDKVRVEMGEVFANLADYATGKPKIPTLLLNDQGEVIILPIEDKMYTREQVRIAVNDAMNMGMDVRQRQLQGYEEKSGKEILDKWFDENYK